jgi:hypothetical protein
MISGAAAAAVKECKRRVHARDGISGYRFVPVAIESSWYGRLGSEALALLHEWTSSDASCGSGNRTAYCTWIKRDLWNVDQA